MEWDGSGAVDIHIVDHLPYKFIFPSSFPRALSSLRNSNDSTEVRSANCVENFAIGFLPIR